MIKVFILTVMLALAATRAPAQETALHQAAAANDNARVRHLIAVGTKIDARNSAGRTALLVATRANAIKAAATLINAGADVNAKDDIEDSPYLYAGAEGRLEILKLTVKAGANLSDTNRYGGTALIPAAHHGHVETVRFLVTTKVPVDHVNKLGWTALMEAVVLGDGSKPYQEIVAILLKARADPNIPDGEGISALSHARQRGQKAVARILKDAGALTDTAGPWRSWRSPVHADHPLAGRVWSTRQRRFVTPRQLADDLTAVKYVLVGEIHDNQDHHRLQAWLISRIAMARTPAVVLEMINVDMAKTLAAYLARADATAAGLGPALGWSKSGWPAWPVYQPIAEAALRARLRLLPGNPGRSVTRTIARRGFDALEGPDLKRLALDIPLPPKLDAALTGDIRQSHCNLLPDKAIAPMRQVQRYRDARLAAALFEAGRDTGAILIAGNGHVRTDRGVPWYLTRKSREATIASVMLLELTADAKTAQELVITGPDGKPAADYFWFTPRSKRADQCEKFRRHMKR